MTKSTAYIAVDLGASSGRVMLGTVDRDVVAVEQVHRFPTRALRLPDGLHWDLGHLYAEVLAGVRAASERGASPRGIGFDSWGVDYALLSGAGSILGAPFHHRDARTAGRSASLDATQLYAATGIQTLDINTLTQLLAEDPRGAISAAEMLLFIPDLFGYLFTGERAAERTIASTSQLLGWDGRSSTMVLESTGIPDLLAPLAKTGSLLGTPLAHVRESTGFTGLVFSVAGHDTASAVTAIPAEPGSEFAFVSCGTWGLVGFELDAPRLDAQSLAAGFTNEQGVDGTYRFLRNVTGLWLLTESIRSWRSAGPVPEFVAAARDVPRFRSLIDPLDPVFVAPGDIPARIAAYCESTGQPVPRTPPEVTRCILDSLALSFADAVRTGSALTGVRPTVIHIVGGGSQIAELCASLADLSGVPVVAGPTEATALGNLLLQARTLGEITSLADIRALVARSASVSRYEPEASPEVHDALERFAAIARRGSGML